jgi:preprotein translocase subunit SecA
MRALERFMLLQIIDERWREHLHDMDYLREGIHLRGFAQIEPIVAYKNEAFDMFTQLMNSIWEEFARYIFVVELEVEEEQPAQQARQNWGGVSNTSSTAAFSYAGGTAEEQPSALAAARQSADGQGANGEYAGEFGDVEMPAQVVETRTVDPKEQIGRNDPCWCGSGKKFKKCHGA